jgi:hypothetical protein
VCLTSVIAYGDICVWGNACCAELQPDEPRFYLCKACSRPFHHCCIPHGLGQADKTWCGKCPKHGAPNNTIPVDAESIEASNYDGDSQTSGTPSRGHKRGRGGSDRGGVRGSRGALARGNPTVNGAVRETQESMHPHRSGHLDMPDYEYTALMNMMEDMKEHLSLLGKRCDETMVMVQTLSADVKIVKESTSYEMRRVIQVRKHIVYIPMSNPFSSFIFCVSIVSNSTFRTWKIFIHVRSFSEQFQYRSRYWQ